MSIHQDIADCALYQKAWSKHNLGVFHEWEATRTVDPVATRRLSRANEDYSLYAERPLHVGNMTWKTTVALCQGRKDLWSHDISGYDSMESPLLALIFAGTLLERHGGYSYSGNGELLLPDPLL